MKATNVFFSALTSMGLLFSSGVASAAGPMNDGQILGFISAANEAEVQSGDVAVTRGQTQIVRDFAAKMMMDHGESNLKLADIETKTNILRAESDAGQELKKNADMMIDRLKNTPEADFDRTYIDCQVRMHEQLIMALDQSLIPAAQHVEIQGFLAETRALYEAHLQEASVIQAGLTVPTP